mgnify:CR=1 FL=1
MGTLYWLDQPEILAAQKAYHFHIYAAYPQREEWELDTDCGPKRLVRFKDPDLLRWSYLWREILAKRGLRQVDRFILTQDRQAYLSFQEDFLVVKDWVEGAALDFSQEWHWRILGTGLAKLHDALKEGWRQMAGGQLVPKHPPFFTEHLSKLPYYFRLLQKKNVLLASLLVSQWSLLLKRCRLAQTYFRKGEASLYHSITFPTLRLYQWKLVADRYLAFEGTMDGPVYGLKGVADLVRRLWVRFAPKRKEWRLFWEAFQTHYPLSQPMKYHLLAFFVVPEEILSFISQYVYFLERGLIENERLFYRRWKRLVKGQEHLDRLALWFGQWLKEAKEDDHAALA